MIKFLVNIASCVSLSLFAVHAYSNGKPYYLPEVDTHIIHSKYVKQSYEILVARPITKKGDTKPLPVLYTTDANLYFDAFRSIASQLPVTPFILVGIAYRPADNLMGAVSLRGRDLLWDGYADLPESLFQEVPIKGVESTQERKGAEKFIRFIRDELIPLIDSRYPTIKGDRGYFGHSAGGSFGLHTIFSQANLFNRLIISSPGISFRGDDFLLRDASKFIKKGECVSASLFVSVGADEEFEPGLMQDWSIVSNYYRLVQWLKANNIEGIEFVDKVFPGETHATVPYMAFSHGVRELYGLRDKPKVVCQKRGHP